MPLPSNEEPLLDAQNSVEDQLPAALESLNSDYDGSVLADVPAPGCACPSGGCSTSGGVSGSAWSLGRGCPKGGRCWRRRHSGRTTAETCLAHEQASACPSLRPASPSAYSRTTHILPGPCLWHAGGQSGDNRSGCRHARAALCGVARRHPAGRHALLRGCRTHLCFLHHHSEVRRRLGHRSWRLIL